MKIIKKAQTEIRNNSPKCAVIEYDLAHEDLDFAVVKLSGRYPDHKRVININCKEAVYVQEGSGKVEVEGKEHNLQAGDLVLIEAGEKFYWEGDMQLHISCRPAFTVDQHQTVD